MTDLNDQDREARLALREAVIVQQREAIHALIRAWPGGKDSVSFAGVVRMLKGIVAPYEWDDLGGSPPMGRCGYEQFEPDNASTPITEQQALEGINAVRNSIVGAQTWNWSEHGYPLVSLLNRAGFKGLPYPEAKEYIGSLIERAGKAEAEITKARELLPWDDADLLEGVEMLAGHADSMVLDRDGCLERAEVAEAALRKIVEWDDAEKPHKNLPLLDCANLARNALRDTGQEHEQ